MHKNRSNIVCLAVVGASLLMGTVHAQTAEPDTDTTIAPAPVIESAAESAAESATTTAAANPRFGFGLQMAPLTFGLSLKYAATPDWSFQGVVSPDDANTHVTLRVLRNLRRSDFWNSYLFGGVAGGKDNGYFGDGDGGLETVISSGLGVEWSWQARNQLLPPLSVSLEFGLGYRNTKPSGNGTDVIIDDRDEVILVLGLGLHYNF